MAKPVKSRRTGRNLLLSVAVGAVPLVGCGPTPTADLVVEPSASIAASPEELALFRQASQTGNPSTINAYLEAYPDSGLVRNLLTELPPDTLRQIDRRTVNGVNLATLRLLPVSVRQPLGLGNLEAVSARDNEPQNALPDGYAG